jgi:hypothetical protein
LESFVHLDLGCLMRERLGVMEEIDRAEGDHDGEPSAVSAASGGRIVRRPTWGGECKQPVESCGSDVERELEVIENSASEAGDPSTR